MLVLILIAVFFSGGIVQLLFPVNKRDGFVPLALPCIFFLDFKVLRDVLVEVVDALDGLVSFLFPVGDFDELVLLLLSDLDFDFDFDMLVPIFETQDGLELFLFPFFNFDELVLLLFPDLDFDLVRLVTIFETLDGLE